jgi:hypothetical protein
MADPFTHLDYRLPALRVRDIILATLQAAFARPDLLGSDDHPYLYVHEDPARSKLWVGTPEARMKFTERDGRRHFISVLRGDYVPQELHLYNAGDGNFSGRERISDLGVTSIMIRCEDGSETGSETLASICYGILKLFRRQIMADYNIHHLALQGISTPTIEETVPGKPWLTYVNLRAEVQEFYIVTERANLLNEVNISAQLSENFTRELASLDGTPLP